MVRGIILILVFIALVCTQYSCVNPQRCVYITTDSTIQSISIDSQETYMHAIIPFKCEIYCVEWDQKPVTIQFDTDSGARRFTQPNIFEVPKYNYFSFEKGSIVHHRFAPMQKGMINYSLTLPFAHGFYLKSDIGYYNGGGSLSGIGSSLDFYYKTNHYFSLAAYAAAASWAEPLSGSDYHNGSGIGVMISDNVVKNDFDLGYGISYMKSSTVHSKDSSFGSLASQSLGLLLQAQYRLGYYFRMGIMYQPTFFTISPQPQFQYQHYMGIMLTWKWNCREELEKRRGYVPGYNW